MLLLIVIILVQKIKQRKHSRTLDYLQWVVSRASEVGAAVKVFVEAGWMNRTNWHLSKWDNRGQVVAKGVSQGRNEQVSRLLGEMCEAYE